MGKFTLRYEDSEDGVTKVSEVVIDTEQVCVWDDVLCEMIQFLNNSFIIDQCAIPKMVEAASQAHNDYVSGGTTKGDIAVNILKIEDMGVTPTRQEQEVDQWRENKGSIMENDLSARTKVLVMLKNGMEHSTAREAQYYDWLITGRQSDIVKWKYA